MGGGGGGVTIMQIRGHGGITHFANSEGRGELKYGSRPWYFLELPNASLVPEVIYELFQSVL